MSIIQIPQIFEECSARRPRVIRPGQCLPNAICRLRVCQISFSNPWVGPYQASVDGLRPFHWPGWASCGVCLAQARPTRAAQASQGAPIRQQQRQPRRAQDSQEVQKLAKLRNSRQSPGLSPKVKYRYCAFDIHTFYIVL